jgi:endonuclease/exonuclease/phosphatase family metal-dependent hydrolase
MEYLQKMVNNTNVSVLCFQEVHCAYDNTVPKEIFPNDPGNRGSNPIRAQLYQEIAEALGPAWVGVFAPQLVGYLHDTEACRYPVGYGQATFVRQSAERQIIGQTFGSVYRQIGQANQEAFGGSPSSKSAIVTTLRVKGKIITICNVHGFWSVRGKQDMSERFNQNIGIANMLMREVSTHSNYQEANVILSGDLNYHSAMQALDHLRCQSVFGVGNTGVNLNHQFLIDSTRTAHYPANKPSREADFIIASQALAPFVHRCWVDLNVPSDHGVLFVELMSE